MFLILSFVTSASYSSIYPSKLAMFSNDKSLFYLFIKYRRSTLSSSGSDYRNPERPRLIISFICNDTKSFLALLAKFTSTHMYMYHKYLYCGWMKLLM